MEEVKKGDLTKAAPQDEEIGVEVLEILLKGGRGGMEGGRQETGDRRQETGDRRQRRYELTYGQTLERKR